jgi:O-antigen ligase
LVDVGGDGLGFEVMSWDFYGQIRAFSLFLSGLDFGYYLCVMGVFLFASAFDSRFRLYFLLLFFVCIYCVFATSTRLVYILFAFSLVTYLVTRIWKSKFIIGILPVVYLLVGSFVIFYLGSGSLLSSSDLSSDDSLFERYFYWSKAWNLWIDASTPQKLFGLGLSQGASVKDYVVDNVYLNSLVQSGLFGVGALIAFFVIIWLELVRSVERFASLFDIAIFSFMSTFLIGFMLNTNQFQYMVLALPVISSIKVIRRNLV